MSTKTTQEIIKSAFEAGSAYNEARMYMGRYGSYGLENQDLRLAEAAVTNLTLALKHMEAAGGDTTDIKTDLETWTEIVEVEEAAALLPLPDDVKLTVQDDGSIS